MHWFGEVQAHRTSSNLLELHPHRDSKVYRLLSHEFGVVRLDRTFSDCIFTGDRRSEGAICTSWMRFKHIEPHRTFSNYILKHFEPQQTFSNYILTELARYLDFFHTSSGWFDWTEPSLTTSLQGIELVQGALCTGSGSFKHIEPHRTFSIYILTEIARYMEFFYTSSGWFDWTEPSLTTSLQGIEGVQGARCTSWMRFKHIEPHRTFSNCILTEIARFIDFFHMSSGWFDCTEPSQTTALQGI